MAHLKVGSTNHGFTTFPEEHVIQVVTANTTSETHTSVSSYATVTGMTAQITPKYSDSKILLFFTCGSMHSGSNDSMYVKITGTTNGTVYENTRLGYSNNASWTWGTIAIQATDLPATVAQQTYQMYAKTQSQPGNANNWRLNSAEETNTESGNVLLMEIKI